MGVFNDFNDLKGAVGTAVDVSDWMEITQGRINKFAEATGDEQWIHVDTERAARALRVTYKVTIEIEGAKRPACVAEAIGQHYR